MQRNDILPDIQILYFDGRRNKTMKLEKEGCCCYSKLLTDEHIHVINEPGNKCLTHITPAFSTVECISNSIIGHYNKSNIELDKLLGIGCDGTPINTGTHGDWWCHTAARVGVQQTVTLGAMPATCK